MKKSLGVILLFLSQLGVWAQNPNPSTAVDNYILDEMDAEKAPGMSALIVKDGEIVWVNSYGLADVGNGISVTDSTVFLLASISKIFTGTALMHLHESGEFGLDEDINNYLPFNIDVPGFENDSITFRMLMTHTSSIKDNGTAMDTYYSTGDPTISLPDVIQRYFSTSGSDYSASGNFSNNAPGSNYDYSNMATALAGYMVEVVSGVPFSEYCNANIFDELCMNSTSWYLADFDTSQVVRPYQWVNGEYVPYAHYGFADYPDGQLRSNVLDLANFMLAYLQGGAFSGQQLLSGNSIDQMLMPQVPSLDATQGLNWYTEEIYLNAGGTVDLWGHNGGESGVSTDLYIDRANQIGVVVLSNGEGDNLNIVDELYNYALTLSPSGIGNPDCNVLSLEEQPITPEIFFYPNPIAKDQELTIAFPNGISQANLEVLDLMGRVVHSQTVSGQQEVGVSLGLAAGVYLVQVKTDGQRISQKLIVR